MPLMPAPPMPTKWMCLTLCFMGVKRERRIAKVGLKADLQTRAKSQV